MKNVTKERLQEVLDYNAVTGTFTWKIKKARWINVGDQAGTVIHNRLRIGIDGNWFFAHRLAWLFVYGEWPKGEIDHIDGNSMNNRIANLRDVSHQINCENQVLGRRKQSSGFTGAYKNKTGRGNFFSSITVRGKRIYLGSFNTAEAAHRAFLEAKRSLCEGVH